MKIIMAQLPSLPSGALETWLLCLLALLPAVAMARKLFARKTPTPDTPTQNVYVSRSDFERCAENARQDLAALRERLDERFLALAEKLDQVQSQLLAAEERRAAAIHQRLNEVESGLARVDERTRR
jgi:hypothetical protein